MKVNVNIKQAELDRIKRVAQDAADRAILNYSRRLIAKEMAKHFAICSAAYHATDVPASSAIHIKANTRRGA